MALNQSPSIVTNGLVFYYDMSNSQKSWRGRPATNFFTNGHFSNGTGIPQESGSNPTNSVIFFPGNPGDSSYVLEQSMGNAFTEYQINLSSELVSNTTYVMSGWYAESADYSGADGSRMFHSRAFSASGAHIATGNGIGTVIETRVINGITWRYCYTTITTPSDYNNNFNWYLGFGGSSYTGRRYYTNIQMEQGTYPSRFVNGARSNTQAILDLTGGNTITASSLTYVSDGSFSFNGINNEMHPPINHSYLSSSALEVIFRSTSHGSGRKTIFGYRHNEGYSNPTIGSLFLENNTLSASVITASQVYRTATSSVSIATNTFYHAVLNKNTSTGLLEIYVNGLLTGSQTFDAATYGQWTGAGQFIGADILDIGKSTNMNSGQGWATDFFNGVIPVAKVYNRVLTAAEVQQNFNALRGRYGL